MTNGYGSTITYWLASRCVNLYMNNCCFRVSRVGSGDVSYTRMFSSEDDYHYNYSALRPVVYLNAELISKNESNEFVVE